MGTDAELVARCQNGDDSAIRALIERYQTDVFALCVRVLRHTQDAEDVAQEVFVRVFRSLHRWDSARPFRPWIFAIALNRCRTALGKRAKLPATAEYLDETPDQQPGETNQELLSEIRMAVDGLRADYREVFILFHQNGQSYEDIAQATERPVGTVKTWLHRARVEILTHLRRRGLVPAEPSEANESVGRQPK